MDRSARPRLTGTLLDQLVPFTNLPTGHGRIHGGSKAHNWAGGERP